MPGNKLNRKKGDALLMTMLILFSIIAVAFGGAALVINGLRNSNLSSQSTVSYYNAESGDEQILYALRKGGSVLNKDGMVYNGQSIAMGSPVISTTTMANGGSYFVNYDQGVNNIGALISFTAVGTYQGVNRSVQVNF